MADSTYYSLAKLHRLDAGKCWLCQMPCPLEDASRDHVIPASMGGAYSWKNFALAHVTCNNQRKDLFPVAPFQGMGTIAQQHAWNRSTGRCEGCGYGKSLVLCRRRVGTERLVQILCVWCSDRALRPAPATPLTTATTGLLPAGRWEQLRAECAHTTKAVAAEAEAVASPLSPEPASEPPAPTVPAPRAAPRFTPADMARQLAAVREREQARAAALAAQREARVQPVPAAGARRPSAIRRAWRALTRWWRRATGRPEPAKPVRSRRVLAGPVLTEAQVRALEAARIRVDSQALHGMRRWLRAQGRPVEGHRRIWAAMLAEDLRCGVLRRQGDAWTLSGEQLYWVIRGDGLRLLATRSMVEIRAVWERDGRRDG